MNTLTRVELDEIKHCEDCGAQHEVLSLGASCHPGAPLFVGYGRKIGCVMLLCAACETPVAQILVAETPPKHWGH